MRIKELRLFTKYLDRELDFYTKTLGLPVLEHSKEHFTIRVGWSALTFARSQNAHRYHYCFLIPSNTLYSALEWMEKRVEIIVLPDGQKTQRFESWDADSFYFYDGSGNVAECIVRHQLHNPTDRDFDFSQLLCVNEIGLPTTDIAKTNTQLETTLGTKSWKGDLERFGTHGSQEGLFLLPNYKVKEFWFPTSLEIRPEPFATVIENQGKKYSLAFDGQKITRQ